MSNMSYCRFENTNRDLEDCVEALETMIRTKAKGDQLSRDELSAAKALAARCLAVVDMLAEYQGRSIEDLDEHQLEDALDAINAECVECDEDDEEEVA